MRCAAGVMVAMVAMGGCADGERVDVVAAASLRQVLEGAVAAGAAGDAEVRLQTGGSAALARRVAELDLHADVLVLADGQLFDELLPEWSPYWIAIAAERLVIAYTDGSRFADELGADTWPEVLLRPRVDVGVADPDLAPVGYRTMMALRLHDLESSQPPIADRLLAAARPNLRPDVAELLAPLQSGAVDYAFMYRSTALLAGLRLLELPSRIDLGDPALAEHYARVQVEVAGPDAASRIVRPGAPILYGAALRPGAPPAAEGVLRWMLSADGREALRAAGFTLTDPIVSGDLTDAVRDRLGLSGSASAPR